MIRLSWPLSRESLWDVVDAMIRSQRKRSRRLAAPVSVGDVLTSPKFRGQLGDILLLYQLQKSWKEVVGEVLAQKTWPSRIVQNRLVVASESPSWAHELSWMRDSVLTAVQEKTGRRLQDIHFAAVTSREKPVDAGSRKGEGGGP